VEVRVPRAKPFSRSHIEQRWDALSVDPALVKKLAEKAGIFSRTQMKQLSDAIQAYRARVLANKQERPAQIVAALRPGLRPAARLLEWLNSLPQSVRLDLTAGGIERLLHELAVLTEALAVETKSRMAYWRGHIETHRLAGEGNASLVLRQSLNGIIAMHLHDSVDATDRQKRANERNRHSWVAYAAKSIGAKYPNEKKNRARFTGERLPISAVKSVKSRPHRRNIVSKQIRARAIRLKGIVF
jgi:hypothetical protein